MENRTRSLASASPPIADIGRACKKSKMRWSASVVLASICPLLLAWAIPAFAASPDSCDSPKLVGLDALELTLTPRSLEIIRLAQQRNLESLSAFVPASARFSIGTLDVILPVGDGPTGAVAFASKLRVSDFQYTIMYGGPPPPVNPCSEQTVSVLLLALDGKRAYQATFRFKAGQLVEAWAHDIRFFNGKIEAK